MSPIQASPRTVLRIVLIIVLVVAVLYVLYLLRKPIGWLVVAGFIAVAISGPVNFLDRHMKRGFAIAIAYLALILLPIALVSLLFRRSCRSSTG